MANIKKGFDYFCFPTDFFLNHHVKRLRRLCGNDGVLVYIYLLSEAYRVEGYALKFCEELVLDTAEIFHLEEAEVEHIIDTCCQVKLFDGRIYRKYAVLTSAEIQEDYMTICRKLGRKNVHIVEELLLLDENGRAKLIEDKHPLNQANNNKPKEKVIVNGDFKTSGICPQRKEMKGKEKKRNEMKPLPSVPSPDSRRGEGNNRPGGRLAEEIRFAGTDAKRRETDHQLTAFPRSADGIPPDG